MKSIPGTVSMPFVYDAAIKAWTGRSFRRMTLHVRATVPIAPIEVSAADLELAIHVKRQGFFPEHDRVMRYDDKLYRKVELGRTEVVASSLQRDLNVVERNAVEDSLYETPPPASALLPRYGLSSPNGVPVLDRAMRRPGWTLAKIEASNHDERWREASAHYHGSVLTRGDELYVRCREPAWQLTSPWRVMYSPKRSAWMSHNQFRLDRFDELRGYWKKTTRVDWRDVVIKGHIHHLDHSFNEVAWLIDLGRQAMSYVPQIRKLTAQANRQAAGCEPLFRSMDLLHSRDGAFTASDAREAIEGVRDLSAALSNVIRTRHIAHEIVGNLSRSKLRLAQMDDRLNELSDEDLDAVRTA